MFVHACFIKNGCSFKIEFYYCDFTALTHLDCFLFSYNGLSSSSSLQSQLYHVSSNTWLVPQIFKVCVLFTVNVSRQCDSLFNSTLVGRRTREVLGHQLIVIFLAFLLFPFLLFCCFVLEWIFFMGSYFYYLNIFFIFYLVYFLWIICY